MPLQEAGSYHGGCFTAIFSTLRLQDEPAHVACVEEAKPKDGRYKATSMVDWKCKHCGKRKDQHFGPPDQRLCRDPEVQGRRQAVEEAEGRRGTRKVQHCKRAKISAICAGRSAEHRPSGSLPQILRKDILHPGSMQGNPQADASDQALGAAAALPSARDRSQGSGRWGVTIEIS